MPSAQGDASITYVIKATRKGHIDSFDTWLQAWNAYEKLVMASHSHQFPELASYREQIQLSNRKFWWPSVYLFDIQTRMAHATKIFHNSGARLDDLNTTLYATILDATANTP